MNKFSVPTREEVTPANQEIFDGLQKALGFVPNLYATFAYSTTGLGRYLALQNTKASLSNKEKEAVNLVVSQVNNCAYCQSAHTVIGKMNGFNDEQIIEFRKGHSTDAKLNALVALAGHITKNRGYTAQDLVDNFYAVGYTNENLVDLVLLVAEKSAMNYLHNLTQIPIDFPLAPTL
jgi:uncharacterized peroxidase-related enzyme